MSARSFLPDSGWTHRSDAAGARRDRLEAKLFGGGDCDFF
jgi:hypothetical protein